MLFLQEIKKIVKSIPYLIFAAAVVIGLFSQGVFRFHERPLQEPQPGETYGFKQEEIPEIIMPAALRDLLTEFSNNNYTTYPIGFIKHVKLSDKEQAKMAEILSEITGNDKETILRETAGTTPGSSDNLSFQIGGDAMQQDDDGGFRIGSDEKQQDSAEKLTFAVRNDMNYSRFKELMGQADSLLGGGSNYAVDSLLGYGSVPLTYEEAKERYDLAVDSDRVTGGYARLFSDYAGVMVLSILPVFLAVILSMKDGRAKMEALIYTKKTSAAKLILIRYLALVTAAMLPVIVLSYLSNMMVWSSYSGMQMDYLAPMKYGLGWLMPSVMISTAIGMFLTELTGTPLAVAVQGMWWMFDVNMGIKTVQSGYSLFRLAPRHNAGADSWFRTQDYLDNFQNLVQNRALIAGISLLLVIFTILIYEAKRKGKFGGNVSFRKAVSGIRNRKNQPQA
ncbi:ABC transporter permease [Lachnospiraceae bacterium 46-15]